MLTWNVFVPARKPLPPVTSMRSFVPAVEFDSSKTRLPEVTDSPPAVVSTARSPAMFPGEIVAPLTRVVVPAMVDAPASVAPFATVTAVFPSEPETTSVPPFTEVAPV